MDTRTEERVNGWDSRSFSGGYERLRDLSDRDFSGAVQTGRTWLFMLNGRIVGLFDGTIEAFEDASGTVYEAPDPALPLLFTMQEKGGETQAKYYSEDTPISEADGTLSSGSFTGYIELSENVLSGDYFVVYYGGRSMAAAYVGNSERLLTGDEAFERADDEVGIYEVKNVDIEVTELPEPDEPDDAGVGGAGAGAAGVGAAGAAGTDAADDDTATPGEGATGTVDAGGTDDSTTGGAPDPLGGAGADDAPDPLGGIGSDDATTVGGGESGDRASTDESTAVNDPTGVAGESGPVDGGPAASEPAGGVDDATPATGSDDSGSDPAGGPTGDADPAADAPDPLDETPDATVGTGTDAGGSDAPTATDEHATAADADPQTGAASEEDTADNRPTGTGNVDSSDPADAREAADSGTDVDLDEVAEELDLMMDEPDDSGESTTATQDPLAEPESVGDSGTASGRGGDESTTTTAGGRTTDESTSGTGKGSLAPGGGTTQDGAPDGAGKGPDYESEQEWRQTRTIPSLNPDETSDDQGQPTAARSRNSGAGGGPSGGPGRTEPSSAGRSKSAGSGRSDARGESQSAGNGPSRRSSGGSSRQSSGGSSRGSSNRPSEGAESGSDDEALGQDMLEREDTIDRLKLKLQELETERDDLAEQREKLAEQREALRERVATLESERDDLAAENEDLTAEVERLESTVSELQAEIESLESSLEEVQGAAATASRKLSRAEALAGTNLFVRYGSKSDATLEDAHAGQADPDSVAENLRLEHHTQFDAADVSVEGRTFEEFLYDTMEYQFVDWAVNRLLFEVRDSGNAGSVQPLYDALPDIDRAELHGEVTLATPEGEEDRAHVFDVVLRDRMGNPLAVVELNDSRDPATQEMMVSLNENATGTKHAADTLAAAFMVTASFFKPDALETASEATSGSLLSRDSRRSFVKLSRKRGYHLCLVESRDGDFHINVPEL